LLQSLRIPRPFHLDLCGGAVDVAEVVRCEFDRKRFQVLFQAMELRGSGDRNNPRLLGKEQARAI
jgi:hypothetical protein